MKTPNRDCGKTFARRVARTLRPGAGSVNAHRPRLGASSRDRRPSF
jgi:hypothetical protein